MFPTRVPLVYVIHLAIIGLAVLGVVGVAAWLETPLLALAALFGLNWIPEFPLVPEPEKDATDGSEYDGTPGFGFAAPVEE
jgi:hypothetical protein